jgi:hypothetical protein
MTRSQCRIRIHPLHTRRAHDVVARGQHVSNSSILHVHYRGDINHFQGPGGIGLAGLQRTRTQAAGHDKAIATMRHDVAVGITSLHTHARARAHTHTTILLTNLPVNTEGLTCACTMSAFLPRKLQFCVCKSRLLKHRHAESVHTHTRVRAQTHTHSYQYGKLGSDAGCDK